MKRLLRALVLLQLRRPLGLWVALAAITAFLGIGIFRVERRLDFMSLLPRDNPIVKASIEAGVGQQELLWVAAEGPGENLEGREAWAEKLVERLLDQSGAPLNGMSGEGRLAGPAPVPEARGVSLWSPLLAAGSLVDGDGAVGRLVTEQLYALAPMLLGSKLEPLTHNAELQRRLRETAKALASPEPARARMAQLDPLGLHDLLEASNESLVRTKEKLHSFPLKLRTGYLETSDGRYVLVPLIVDFPSSDAKATGRVLNWLGQGAQGPLPMRTSLSSVEQALAAHGDRAFPLQITGAHAIAYWESQRLTREVLMSLALSFVLIGVVYWIGYRTLAGYGFVVVPLLVGMIWALGMVGWILGHLNLMAAAFGAVLLGIGDDVGILLFSRYRDERAAGRAKALALRAAILGTGPGVVAGALATSLAFLACIAAPFPGFRDLGLTAGLGLLSCLVASFLLLPALMLAFDKGRGVFAPVATETARTHGRLRPWKPILALALLVLGILGIPRLTWMEDLRKFRQSGNPALVLQETLGKVLGAGLQPLAIQIPLDDPEHLPQTWNKLVVPLRREGLPMPLWADPGPDLRRVLASETWFRKALEIASQEGLDPIALERPLAALRASATDPGAVPRSLEMLAPPASVSVQHRSWTLFSWFQKPEAAAVKAPVFTLPLRLPEAAQDRVEDEITAAGARLVGNRPLFRAVRAVAKESLRDVILLALSAVLIVVSLFGRRWRFAGLALVPLAASQIGVLGILGWSGEPLTFLSLVAIPIALGVSVDTAMNLLHRSRMDPQAAAKVARVNAVCAGTTLAGFGGLVFSGYRALRGLGLASLGGVALALIATQWILPWMLEKWPLRKERP